MARPSPRREEPHLQFVLVLAGIAWWVACETLRGRPTTPGTTALALQFAGPLGAIGCMFTVLFW